MTWSADTAEQRIRKLLSSVPEAEVIVEDFARYQAERSRVTALDSRSSPNEANSLLRIPRNRAITTNGVHIYANLMDFSDRLIEGGRETEASHKQALQFLHLHYSACDQLIVSFGLQRVDFHGGRLHAVVLSPVGAEAEPQRIQIALSFAAAFRRMVAENTERYGAHFGTRVCIGIDSGPAVAIDGGKRSEPEPLFIGSPANYAAKLADGDQEGIVVSPRVRRILAARSLDLTDPSGHLDTREEEAFLREVIPSTDRMMLAEARLREAASAFANDSALQETFFQAPSAVFHFHHKAPPLKTIQFTDHPPSNAIRMPLASIFADLDHFTAYIDAAIAQGAVAQAVANLHVLRGEMAAVLRDDFGGRKVRFIGDCLHGLLAEGDKQEIDSAETISQATLAAGAIRSSFDLCKRILPGISSLGLAIGIDFGQTPICRLGLRGESSVRCSTSRATSKSEAEQRGCNGTETALGEGAFTVAPHLVKQAFGNCRKIQNLTYNNALVLLGMLPTTKVHVAESKPFRAHSPAVPMRAHSRS